MISGEYLIKLNGKYLKEDKNGKFKVKLLSSENIINSDYHLQKLSSLKNFI